ncbi:hypothetical protein [Ureaplasma ceti]|uniref:Uncharacterized protein n=1 Tax=Ureaplasma ceti TaxID=3119530 RepID=A0ABP9U5U3_9BACT
MKEVLLKLEVGQAPMNSTSGTQADGQIIYQLNTGIQEIDTDPELNELNNAIAILHRSYYTLLADGTYELNKAFAQRQTENLLQLIRQMIKRLDTIQMALNSFYTSDEMTKWVLQTFKD